MSSQDEKFTERLASVIDDAGGASVVAKSIGVTPNAVRLWALGTKPYRQHILALCEKLGVDRHWLLTGEASKNPAANSNAYLQSLPTIAEHCGEFEALSDDELAVKIVEMIKSFPKVPAAYGITAIELLRKNIDEFMLRARRKHPSGPTKYSDKSNHKPRKP